MNDSNLLVICDEVNDELNFNEYHCKEPVFLLQNDKKLHCTEPSDEVLQYLVFLIRRQPKNLLAHMQRIIVCYDKSEAQLYASIVDFFMALQGSGLAIKKRVLAGAKRHLSETSMQCLHSHLNDRRLLPGNNYSVLTLGIESRDELVAPAIMSEVILNNDPLQIAQDYIEFSQLEEAQKVLEEAVLSAPERIELHDELLGLYQATNNVDAFIKMQQALSTSNHLAKPRWNELNSYFNNKK